MPRKTGTESTGSVGKRRSGKSKAAQLPALGDRVKFLLDGEQAQGFVAFAGPTSFGDGDWVGLTLDEPIGRNDGSVQGVRYFDCADKHGMFIRPQMIIPETENPAVVGTESMPSVGERRSRKSKATQLPALGDRVKFLLDGEQAQGVVAFAGPTSFGKGDWVGLTLDEPIGRNDGSVQGVRYFDCAASHGVFVKAGMIIPEPDNPAVTGTVADSPIGHPKILKDQPDEAVEAEEELVLPSVLGGIKEDVVLPSELGGTGGTPAQGESSETSWPVQICESELESHLAMSQKRVAELEEELAKLRQTRQEVIHEMVQEPEMSWWASLGGCCSARATTQPKS